MTGRPGPRPAGLDRDGLVAAVASALGAVPADAAVVVACSGGPDSTALAYLVDEARPDLQLTLVHVRHGLRDDREDVAVVERHAAYLGAPLEVVNVRVERRGGGIEAAARTARYGALREVAARVGAVRVLVGHTADDQAETALLRIARGTGVSGLAAMRPDRGDLARPLLGLRRSDVHRFVAFEGLPTAEDPMNADPAVRRVAVRQRVLPALEQVAADPVGALGRLTALAADDEDALGDLAAAARDDLVVRTGEVASLRADALGQLPRAVRRRVWRLLLVTAEPDDHPPASAVVAAVEALRPGRQLRHGALQVTFGGGWYAVAPAVHTPADPVTVAVPGVTDWPPVGGAITARTPTAASEDGAPTGQIAFELTGAWSPPRPATGELLVPPGGSADRCTLALPAADRVFTVRHRRPGDRCRTGAGTARVADLMVDARLPRPLRDRWPVVVDGDRVVWVPAIAADAELLAAGRAAPAVQLVLGPRPPV